MANMDPLSEKEMDDLLAKARIASQQIYWIDYTPRYYLDVYGNRVVEAEPPRIAKRWLTPNSFPSGPPGLILLRGAARVGAGFTYYSTYRASLTRRTFINYWFAYGYLLRKGNKNG